MALDKELGPVLTVKDMAKLLGVCQNTIRNHYKRWGGVEVAPGKYHFFENIVRDIIYANVGETGEAEVLERRCDGPGGKEGTTLPGRNPGGQKKGDSLGERNKGKLEEEKDPNRHGLLET